MLNQFNYRSSLPHQQELERRFAEILGTGVPDRYKTFYRALISVISNDRPMNGVEFFVEYEALIQEHGANLQEQYPLWVIYPFFVEQLADSKSDFYILAMNSYTTMITLLTGQNPKMP